MIIQICGTNGSGKTTAMRAVMAQGSPFSNLPVNGKDYGLSYSFVGVASLVLVMGKYGEVATGGCDRISDVKSIRPVIAEQCAAGLHVLFEGIRMMNHTDGVKFCTHTLFRGVPYHVVLLRTTLEECLEGIRQRQIAATGTTKDLVVGDIKSNITRARNYATKLAMVGAKLHGVSRDEAPVRIMELIQGQRDQS